MTVETFAERVDRAAFNRTRDGLIAHEVEGAVFAAMNESHVRDIERELGGTVSMLGTEWDPETDIVTFYYLLGSDRAGVWQVNVPAMRRAILVKVLDHLDG